MPMPPLPRVLCRGWRSSTGRMMPCASPVMQEGEEGGRVVVDAQCKLCGALNATASEARWQREGRKLLRDRKRGYGGPKDGEDVFRGFRQEG